MAFLCVGMLFYLKMTPPTETSVFPACQWYLFTGLHCPGCGLTRALHSLLNGEFRQAMAWNALGLLLLPYLALSLIRSLWTWAWCGESGADEFRLRWRGWPWLLAFVLVAYSLLRNLPGEPFCWLAPHEIQRAE
jgi:hypothetical protein